MPERHDRAAPAATVLAVVERRLALVHDRDHGLGSLVHVDAAGARRTAAALDARPVADRGPLHGVVVVVKDNVDVAGQVTGCCSPARGQDPATQDAPVVARLRAAGAVVLGRANMDELAMGASTATSVHGPTRNPWDPGRSPGGSSGGCAAAVAAGIADLAVGTDTGGSVREPASQCGVWGLAPTPGLLPVAGVVPFAPSCDRVGPIAADGALLRRATAVMAGRDLVAEPPRPRRVGVVEELCGETNHPGVRSVLRGATAALERAGVEVVPVSVPDAPGALAAYLTLTSVECLPHLRPWTRTGRTGAEVTRRTRIGERLLVDGLERLAEAADLRGRLTEQVTTALEGLDALVSPTMPTTAPRFAPAGPPTTAVADPMTAPYTDCWTVVANLVGAPAVSVPAGTSTDDGMPAGVMLLGAPGTDDLLLDLGLLVADPTPL